MLWPFPPPPVIVLAFAALNGSNWGYGQHNTGGKGRPMADETKTNAAVADCLAAIALSSDPLTTINEFCFALVRQKDWTDAEVTVVQRRVRRALYSPH